MSRLIIRAKNVEINLSTEGNGVYNMQEYDMGIPTEDEEANILLCNDTIMVNIVGRSRTEVATYVARVYKALRAAVEYYEYHSSERYVLEASITGENDSQPVWAAIRSFEFHKLNDPYDVANGDIIQSASMIITREPWQAAPPQDAPYEIVDMRGNDISDNFILPIDYALPALALWKGEAIPTDTVTSFPTFTDQNELFIMTNMYRYDNIKYIYRSYTASLGDQQITYIPSAGESYSIGSLEGGGQLRMVIGAQGRLSGIVFPMAGGTAGGVTGLDVKYRDAAGNMVSMSQDSITNYLDLWRQGVSYLGLKELRLAWSHGTIGTLPAAWWLDIRVTTNNAIPAIPAVRANHVVHTPFTPFVDVTPPPSDLDAALHMKITGLTPWEWLDSTFGTSYSESPYHMNGLIIASSPIPSPSHQNVDPGIGFYSLAENSPYVDPDVGFQMYSPFHGLIPGMFPWIPTEASPYMNGAINPVAEITVPTRPGVYRAFVRYMASGVPTKGRATLFMSTSPSRVENVHDGFVMRRPYTIDLSDTSNREGVCLADFGVISIGNRASRRTHSETSYHGQARDSDAPSSTRIKIEVLLTLDSQGSLLVGDVILLPMNKHYMTLSMSRGPLARNASLSTNTTDTQDMWFRASEFAYASSLYTGAGVATVATDQVEARAGIPEGPQYPYFHHRNIGEEIGLINSQNIYIPPGTKRRYWFLWYKETGTGVVWSYPDFQTAIKMYAVPRYLTLPAR